MTQKEWKKNSIKKLVAIGLVMLFMVSCTIQRRHHLPGVYIDLRRFSPGQDWLESGRLDTMDVNRSLVASDAGMENDLPPLKPAEPLEGKVTGEPLVVVQKTDNSVTMPIQKEIHETITEATTDMPVAKQVISGEQKETSGDSYFYLIAAGMMTSALLIIAAFRKFFLNITRWAKEHPKKTRVLITTASFTMTGLALYSGHNLYQMGYNVSNSTSWISGIIMTLSFLFIPFRVKRDTIAHPKTVAKRRFAHAAIIASSFVLIMAYGNKMEERHPNSPVTKFITAIDHAVFPGDVTADVADQEQKPQIYRASAGAGVIIVAVLLFILLLVTLCASVCLIIFACAGAFAGAMALLAVLGGLVGSALSIFGMVSVVKWTQKKDREAQNNNRLDSID